MRPGLLKLQCTVKGLESLSEETERRYRSQAIEEPGRECQRDSAWRVPVVTGAWKPSKAAAPGEAILVSGALDRQASQFKRSLKSLTCELSSYLNAGN